LLLLLLSDTLPEELTLESLCANAADEEAAEGPSRSECEAGE